MKDQEVGRAFSYFLGELGESEQSALEERFFADEQYSLFLDRAENLLVDLYAGGGLSPRQKRDFEKRFLISERRREMLRRRLELEAPQTGISSEKRKSAGEKNTPSALPRATRMYPRRFFERLFGPPDFARAAGAVLIGLAILTASAAVFWRQTEGPENDRAARTEGGEKKFGEPREVFSPETPASRTGKQTPGVIEKLAVGPEWSTRAAVRAGRQRRDKALLRSPAEPNSAAAPAFTLLPPVMAAEKRLVVGARAKTEKIRLRVVHNNEQNYVKYLVEIRASDGDVVWSREIAVNEKTLHKPLAIAVRGGAMSEGDYGLTVSGATGDGQLEEINNYNFTFQKK